MKSIIVGFAVLTSTVNMQVQANENIMNGVYLGGTFGLYSATSDIGSGSTLSEDGRNPGFSFQLGYAKSFEKWNIGVEYQRNGSMGDAENDLNAVSVNQGWSVSLLPGINIVEGLLVYGRIGKGSAEVETMGFFEDYIENIDVTVYGLGGKYKVMPNISISAEYKMLSGSKNSTEIDIQGVELGAQYLF